MRITSIVVSLLLGWLVCKSLANAAMLVVPPTQAGERLTPPVGDAPSINHPRVYGMRPNADIVFRVPISGLRPMQIVADGLPAGTQIDARGIITGRVATKGDYKVKVTAKNPHGQVTQVITLRIGDTLTLTPPMGWNSWYSFNEAVSQENVLAVAGLMHESGLADHGWSYVNIDDCWQGARDPQTLVLQANDKFPDMGAMCAAIHALGLKAGIYSGPWISTYAGHLGGSSDSADGSPGDFALPPEKRRHAAQFFGPCPGLAQLKVDRIGKYWHFDKDAKQWAEWGFDYVKVDWKPNDIATTERVHADLAVAGRPIALSLSNEAPYRNMPGLSKYANVTRTTADIHDSWGSISGIGFSQERWQVFVRPGCWCDPDMLQVGNLGKTGQANTKFFPTNLTPDEQYTQVTLWCLLSAPLLLSCDFSALDDFTMGLLINDEVIAVNQDHKASPCKRVYDEAGIQIWAKQLHDGSLAVGVFNLNDEPRDRVAVGLDKLGLKGAVSVRDLWRRNTVGKTQEGVVVSLRPHGVVFLRFW